MVYPGDEGNLVSKLVFHDKAAVITRRDLQVRLLSHENWVKRSPMLVISACSSLERGLRGEKVERIAVICAKAQEYSDSLFLLFHW
jgi:hypothetical protein